MPMSKVIQKSSDWKKSFQETMYNPHHFLGLHTAKEEKVIRLFRPGASKVHIELFGKIMELSSEGQQGFFEIPVPKKTTAKDYKVYHQNGLLSHDPYAFLPTFGELDKHLFSEGLHYELYNVLGGRLAEVDGCKGVKFAVWAPNAMRVSLIADFNYWDGRANPMRSLGSTGIWELFVPGIGEGEKYKFEVHGEDGRLRVKSDPLAYSSELRPNNASVIRDVDRFAWQDGDWASKRKERFGKACAIYEVHLGSWKKNNGTFLNYREMAHKLAEYVKEMGFTHVELMPVSEHPLDESWGYQVTGFYAVTSRFGTPEDFQYFVNHLHLNGIGVILDWVPAHFPTDDFSLAQFDGSYLYEHADPRQGFHPHWNTYIFNYGRKEVANFLLACALYWFDKMHVDGLRVDAVASMLYLDYGRKDGEWVPNFYGGKENLEAIEFLKHLNSIVHERFPGVMMCAEESTAFTGVSHPLEWGGLGFDFKWNMGWMNDTLRYFHKDPVHRKFHQNELTFSLIYAFTERFILVLSHDEVVHGKKNLISKMPGDTWQKFANVRLIYSYMICHPGKKLLFMGMEVGQWDEWYCKAEVQWFLLDYPYHRGLQECIKKLNHFYQGHQALWRYDEQSKGFEWIDFSDHDNSVICYLRKADNAYVACVHNFTPNCLSEYFVRLGNVGKIKEIFNTDREEFGGSGKINAQPWIVKDEGGQPIGFMMQLAPLATMIFEVEFV